MADNKLKNRVGEKYENNSGETFTIVRYEGNKLVDVEFKDGTIVRNRAFNDIVKGKIINPNTPSVYGVGYVGQGSYSTSSDRLHTKNYSQWKGMLTRCYSNKDTAYKDVTVCREWHNFQNFAKWHEENFKPHMKGWHLDKDILVKGNKIYSPETCCFVPTEVNNIVIRNRPKRGDCPIGTHIRGLHFDVSINKGKGTEYIGTFYNPEDAFLAYKEVKEEYVKEMADKWRGQITEQTYEALINYQVEITD